MKTSLIVIGLLLVGAVFATKDYIIPHAWRYKITIEIETPEGIKSGSAIREVRARKNIARLVNPDLKDVTYRTVGEAVAIDLKEKGVFFYPVDWDSNNLLESAFPTKIVNAWEKVKFYKSLPLGEEASLTGWKSMIWLKNSELTEPMKRLDSKDFEQVLGNGYKFKKTNIKITNKNVTWKLDSRIESLKYQFGNYSRESFQFGKD